MPNAVSVRIERTQINPANAVGFAIVFLQCKSLMTNTSASMT